MDAFQQFRYDVLNALAAIHVELRSLQEAIKESGAVSPTRLEEIRSESLGLMDKFREYQAQHVALISCPTPYLPK